MGEVLGVAGMGEGWMRKLEMLRGVMRGVKGIDLNEWLECEGESEGVRVK